MHCLSQSWVLAPSCSLIVPGSFSLPLRHLQETRGTFRPPLFLPSALSCTLFSGDNHQALLLVQINKGTERLLKKLLLGQVTDIDLATTLTNDVAC